MIIIIIRKYTSIWKSQERVRGRERERKRKKEKKKRKKYIVIIIIKWIFFWRKKMTTTTTTITTACVRECVSARQPSRFFLIKSNKRKFNFFFLSFYPLPPSLSLSLFPLLRNFFSHILHLLQPPTKVT